MFGGIKKKLQKLKQAVAELLAVLVLADDLVLMAENVWMAETSENNDWVILKSLPREKFESECSNVKIQRDQIDQVYKFR